MKRKVFQIVLYSLIGLNSCTTYYTVDINDFERQMVVNCLFAKDSLFKINVVEETLLNEDLYDAKPISGAQIILFQNNIAMDTPYYDTLGNYLSKFKPQFGITYKIHVSFDSFNSIQAESSLPKPIDIDSLVIIEKEDELNSYLVKFQFNDPAEEDNFYLISFGGGMFFQFTSEDPSFGETDTYSSKIPVFSDELFNGQKKEVLYDLKIYEKTWLDSEDYVIAFKLYSISKEYYLYALSQNRQQPVDNDSDLLNDFQQGLIEPLPIYSNIENGQGLFAGYSLSIDSLKFEIK